jgi:hypothetical protein
MVQWQYDASVLYYFRRANSCLIPDRATVEIDQVRMKDHYIFAELYVRRDRHRLEGIP